MKRNIITIDEKKCTGCGECIPGCPEGAIQVIDGKARLVSDLMCDGLGACLGTCPEKAITIEEREAEPYDERKVMENIVKAGANTIKAHLRHLNDHGQHEYLEIAINVLREKNIAIPDYKQEHHHGGCPGSRAMNITRTPENHPVEDTSKRPSELTQWPIQMHLINPKAPYFAGVDLLIAADCTAFTVGDFHKDFLKNKKLVIACPKLDEGLDIYQSKIKALIDETQVKSITVMIMQVPCCGGLMAIVNAALQTTTRKIPVKKIVVSLEGQILEQKEVFQN